MAEQQSDRTKEQWIDKGLAHIHQRGQGNEALDAFEHALGLEPTDIVANLGKGHSLWKLGRTEEARAIYEQFLPQVPTDAPGFYLKGCALYSLQQYLEALAAF